jgi:hypothetical protein
MAPHAASSGSARDRAPRRVYFIGAGFSAPLNYPLGNGLVRQLISYLEGSPPAATSKLAFRSSLGDEKLARRLKTDLGADGRRLARACRRILEVYCGSSADDIESVGVTEFFTIAQMIAESPKLFARAQAHVAGELPNEHVHGCVAAATRSYFHDLCVAQEMTLDVRTFSGSLDPERDVVVCFNWDEELDVGIDNAAGLDIAYTYDSWNGQDEILLLKPHGSIGWYDVARRISNKGCYHIAEGDPRIARFDRRIVGYVGIELPRDFRNRPISPLECPPVVMAPTFAKRVEYAEQAFIWQDVVTACTTATEIVFLGYSLPADDYLTRAALRAALNGGGRKEVRCLVVDRDVTAPGMRRRFTEALGGSLGDDRHYMPWSFGDVDPSFMEGLDSALASAVIT